MAGEMVLPATSLALDAEKSILGAMLNDPAAIDRAVACLTPAAFYHRAHAEVFKAIADMRARHEPVTIVTLVREIEARDELQQVGGASALASLHEYATATENVEAHARIVRQCYAERERVRIGLRIANGADPSPEGTIAEMVRLEAIQRSVDGIESAAKKWASQSMTGRELVDSDIPPIRSWLGDGLIPEGELAFLNGQSGVGKTFLVVQLMSALSIGHTFNGIETRKCRVGLIEIEMPWASIQKRVASLHSGDLDAMAFFCSPPGALHVCEPSARENIAEFCRRHSLDLLIIDPFNRLHDGDENSGSDMGHTVEGLHEIRRLTGASILVLHHVRKSPSGLPSGGQQSRSGSLDAGRGHSRLHNDPATVMHLDEAKGFVRFSFVKVRHAREPLPIYLKRNNLGFFDVAEDPALAKDRRRDSLQQMLEKSGGEGVSAALASEILGVTERTVQRDLKELGANLISRGKTGRVWVLTAPDSGEFDL